MESTLLFLREVLSSPLVRKSESPRSQLLALIDGLDWTKVRPVAVKRPESVG